MKKTINTVILLIALGVFYACEDKAANYRGARHYETESIFVIENDVYVNGWYNPDKTTQIIDCYWVNGERVDRNIVHDAAAISARYGDSVSFSFRSAWSNHPYIVSNGDVYTSYDLGYTKNGEQIEVVLDDLDGVVKTYDYFYGLAVSEEDVYVIGEIVGHDGEKNRKDLSFIWKNGVAEYYDRDYYFDINVADGDVYTIDFQHAYRNNVFIEGSYSEKNYYISIQADRGDVYVFGWVRSTNPGLHKTDYCYWKNNKRIEIDEGNEEWVTSMYVESGDVYFSSWYNTNGYYHPDAFDTIKYSRPCYYKNGERIDLN